MKKLLSLTIAVVMLATMMISVMPLGVSANDISVPECVGAQKTAVSDGKQNIRLVSEVSEDVVNQGINALGYDVVATFINAAGKVKYITYNVEGTEVYTSLKATDENGEENKVEPKSGTYFFALTITGVPTTYGNIFLDVTTYSRIGENKTYSAASAEYCFDSGVESTRTLVYAENFDGYEATSNTATLNLLGWVDTKLGTSVTLKTSDDSVTLNDAWSAYQFVEADETLKAAKSYDVEMDVTVSKGPIVNIIFQTDRCYEGDKLGGDSFWVSFRGYEGSALKDGTTTGTLGVRLLRYIRKNNEVTEGATNYVMQATQGGASDTAFITDVNNKLSGEGVNEFGWTANENEGISNTFRVKVSVDNTASTVTVYVNGVQVVTGYHQIITSVDRISLLSQKDNAKIDNIIVTCK